MDKTSKTTINKLQEQVERKFNNNYPLNQEIKYAIEKAVFKTIKVLSIQTGFPIYTMIRDITINKPLQGEIWLEDISGTRKVCSFINGVRYCSTLV